MGGQPKGGSDKLSESLHPLPDTSVGIPTAPRRWPAHDALPARTVSRRVLHIATRYLPGGFARNLAHFVDWELASGYDVDVAFGPESTPVDFPAGVRLHEVRSLVRPIDPLRDLLALRELRRLVRGGRYDLVHTHLSKSGVLGRLAARGVAPRTVHTIHMASFGVGYHPIASLAYRALERHCASFSDRVISVGVELSQMYRDAGIGGSPKHVVIHSPIDVSDFGSTRAWSSARRLAVRHKLGIPDAVPLILAIGALEARKRHSLIIRELAPGLRARSYELVVAGDGREYLQLVEQVARLGVSSSVHFLGHVQDPAELFAAADLLIHAATVEGVPQVVIQALAAGRSVVATDVTGLREVSDAPVVVLPSSGVGLAASVHETIRHPRPQVELESLRPWTCAEIDASIADLYAGLGM